MGIDLLAFIFFCLKKLFILKHIGKHGIKENKFNPATLNIKISMKGNGKFSQKPLKYREYNQLSGTVIELADIDEFHHYKSLKKLKFNSKLFFSCFQDDGYARRRGS